MQVSREYYISIYIKELGFEHYCLIDAVTSKMTDPGDPTIDELDRKRWIFVLGQRRSDEHL